MKMEKAYALAWSGFACRRYWGTRAARRPRQPPGRPRELARPPSVTGGPGVGESLEPAGDEGAPDQAPSVLAFRLWATGRIPVQGPAE